jgi:hypothetical protein
MESLIYQNKKALNEYLCDDMITMFELNKVEQQQGITIGGLQRNIKETYDITFSNESSEYWSDCSKHIIKVLYNNLREWKKQFKLSEKDTYALTEKLTLKNSFILQKYEKNRGKYIYHDDFAIASTREHRVATFIFYLNTVENGGETEFMDTFKIKPEKGKLVLFPACWTYYHRGKMPISDNKYIITGWLYTDSFVSNND